MKIGDYVVCRTLTAGVHVGYMVERVYMEVRLRDARRLWNWTGANTLHEVANHGVAKASKVSESTGKREVILTQVIEVLEASEEAEVSLKAAKWSK